MRTNWFLPRKRCEWCLQLRVARRTDIDMVVQLKNTPTWKSNEVSYLCLKCRQYWIVEAKKAIKRAIREVRRAAREKLTP